MYPRTITPDSSTETWNIYGSGTIPFSRPNVWISSAIAYIEIPELKIVIIAKVKALSARVFSSKRILRYSGTERAFEP